MVQEKGRSEEAKHLRKMRRDGMCGTRRHDTKEKGSFFLVTGEKARHMGTSTGGGWSSAVREWEVV